MMVLQEQGIRCTESVKGHHVEVSRRVWES